LCLSLQAGSQQHKQTHTHATVGLTLHPAHDLLALTIFSFMDTMTLQTRAVSFNPNNQKNVHNSLTNFAVGLTMSAMFFPKMFKIVQNN